MSDYWFITVYDIHNIIALFSNKKKVILTEIWFREQKIKQ